MLLVGLVTLSYPGLALTDQGNPSKVLTVDNPSVSCQSPVAGSKVEGELGRTIVVSAEDPIDFVTLKSGVGVATDQQHWGVHLHQRGEHEHRGLRSRP